MALVKRDMFMPLPFFFFSFSLALFPLLSVLTTSCALDQVFMYMLISSLYISSD